MYTILLIRDFPTFPIGWRGSYIFAQYSSNNSIDWIILKTTEEIQYCGNKYGAIIYDPTGREFLKIDQNGKRIES